MAAAIPSFPLTPALSLRERENDRPSAGQPSCTGQFAVLAPLFPLPEGEGKGEGKEHIQSHKDASEFVGPVRPQQELNLHPH
jgi:hypothetical protein